MDDRLQRALDGDLAPGDLTAALAADLKESRALLDGVVRAIPARPIPDLGAAVLRRIEAAERPPALRRGGPIDEELGERLREAAHEAVVRVRGDVERHAESVRRGS